MKQMRVCSSGILGSSQNEYVFSNLQQATGFSQKIGTCQKLIQHRNLKANNIQNLIRRV
jgi:hypothetical protein